jgi:hypothetical protein
MKQFIVAACVLSLSLVAVAALPRRNHAVKDGGPAGARAPVIVELFTSEGCSSCPPADTLLSKLEDLQPVEGAEVIALEEHVDYWNNLGWTDPFSSGEFTSRQRDYAEAFNQRSVYTPQMVVDGSKELVGSRGRDVRITIADAARQPKMEMKLAQDSPAKENALQFSVSTGKFSSEPQDNKVDVWVAVTERRLHSDVKRGENAGEDLHHAAVVRLLRKIGTADMSKEMPFSGTLAFPLEHSWQRENLLIVTFAQERKSKRIVGATTSKLL